MVILSIAFAVVAHMVWKFDWVQLQFCEMKYTGVDIALQFLSFTKQFSTMRTAFFRHAVFHNNLCCFIVQAGNRKCLTLPLFVHAVGSNKSVRGIRARSSLSPQRACTKSADNNDHLATKACEPRFCV